MKKILSVLVAVLLLCTLIPAVFAAETTNFTSSAANTAEKDYIEKGDTVRVTVYQSGAACSGFHINGLSYNKDALQLVGNDVDGDGWIEPAAGTGLAAVLYGPNGIAGMGFSPMTDRVAFTLDFVVLAESGEFSVSFTDATADGAVATVSGCSFTVGVPHIHTPAEAVKENEVEPTCTEDGGYDLVVYCSECGEELSRDHVVLEALGHDWDKGVIGNQLPYDCGDEFLIYACGRCDATKTEDHGHDCEKAKFTLDSWYDTEKKANYTTYQEKCFHSGTHGCSTVYGEAWTEEVVDPITGDITPYIAMGVLTMVSLVSAAAYLLLKRKAV